MNDTKNLEMRLRSWTPRRPSRTVEDKLFSRTVAPEPSRLPFRFRLLAPSAAALVLLGLLASDRTPQGINTLGIGPTMVAVISSNVSSPSNIIAAPLSRHSQHLPDALEVPASTICVNTPSSGPK